MSAQKSAYQAYSVATRTVAKTRQVVMLYDGAIRFLKQAQTAIAEKRIEDRFKLLARASDIMAGLQNSIDFDNGGEVAQTLHKFYTNMCMRILSINFNVKDASTICDEITRELKDMRDVWENIDHTLNTPGAAGALGAAPALADIAGSVVLSA